MQHPTVQFGLAFRLYDNLQTCLCVCYLVHLCLRCLLQCVQHNLQVFLELPTDGQCNVTEHREDLRLHRAMHILILHTHTHTMNNLHHSVMQNIFVQPEYG